VGSAAIFFGAEDCCRRFRGHALMARSTASRKSGAFAPAGIIHQALWQVKARIQGAPAKLLAKKFVNVFSPRSAALPAVWRFELRIPKAPGPAAYIAKHFNLVGRRSVPSRSDISRLECPRVNSFGCLGGRCSHERILFLGSVTRSARWALICPAPLCVLTSRAGQLEGGFFAFFLRMTLLLEMASKSLTTRSSSSIKGIGCPPREKAAISAR